MLNKAMLNTTTGFDDLEDSPELEEEIGGFFEYLSLVADTKKHSLSETIDTIIDEEEKFIEWKNSGETLDNIRLFHKVNGELIPIIQQYQISYTDSQEDTVELEIIEDSQFEIWQCDENRKRRFPLYRVPLSAVYQESKFYKEERLYIGDQLRNNFSLKIQARKENSSIFFTFSVSKLEEETSFVEKISAYWRRNLNFVRRGFFQHKSNSMLVAVNILFLLLISSPVIYSLGFSGKEIVNNNESYRFNTVTEDKKYRSTSPTPISEIKTAAAENSDKDRAREIREAQRMIRRCYQERCGDKNYLPLNAPIN
jgi:hypothetical protein